jgi:hypothetical protein
MMQTALRGQPLAHLSLVPTTNESTTMKSQRAPAPAALLRAVVPAEGEVEESPSDVEDVLLEPDLEPESASEAEEQRLAVQTRLSAYFTSGRPRVVFTDNLHTMLSIKRGQGVWTLRMHRMFAMAPPQVLRAVAHYAQTQNRQASELLRRFIDHHEHLIREQAEPRGLAIDVQGAHHNLQEIFDELNAQYFGGAVKARITWGPRARRKSGRESIKLGSYSVEEQLIRIHPVLDASDVPRFFVAWIIYHEMLHEVHDMPVVDGRRVYHTREFRRAEAQFERYAEAVLWERTQVRKLLDR